ncbi:MAG: hypothetical protein ABJJ53_17105 [Sulfitobacter sp.]
MAWKLSFFHGSGSKQDARKCGNQCGEKDEKQQNANHHQQCDSHAFDGLSDALATTNKITPIISVLSCKSRFNPESANTGQTSTPMNSA